MIKEDSFTELARDCVRTCHVLKTVTEGRDVDNLSGLSEKQIEDLGRCVTPDRLFLLKIMSDNRIIRHIESVVSECWNWHGHRSQEYPGHIKECLIAGRTEMWQILRTFDVRGFQSIVATVSKPPQEDPSLPLPPGSTNSTSKPPLIFDSNKQTLQRLISRAVPQDELPSVIAAVVSNIKAADIVECLQGSDAQTFIDIIDEACNHAIPSPRNRFTDLFSNLLISPDQALDSLDLMPRTRKKCVKLLYKACASHTLLPRSLHFELHGDPVGIPSYGGGFGDVWKREHRGKEVAVKVLRLRYNDGSRDINNVSIQLGFYSPAHVG